MLNKLNLLCKINYTSKIIYVLLLLGISVSFINTVNSQFLKLPKYYNLKFSTVLSGKQTPFWLASNNYGLISPNGNQTYFKTSFKTHLDSARSFDYCYNIEVVGKYSDVFKSYFQQVYFETKFKFLNFYIGSKEEIFGNQDKDLSSGNLLWSGNARPMPKVMIYTPDFVKVPFTKGYIEIIGGLAHGWFGKNEFVNNAWLHHKYIGFRIGGNLPVRLNHQFHHFAQWGGTSADTAIGKLPSSWGDFKQIFLGRSGKGTSDVIQDEALNMIGNHLGMDNYGIEVELKNYLLNAYWQHMYEDGSGKAWKNIKDGLWGVSFSFKKNPFLKNIVLEYLNTTNQSREVTDIFRLNDSLIYLHGNDNYFNNYVYIKGWSYKEMTIGTPFITSPAVIRGGHLDYIRNNKVNSIYVCFTGKIKQTNYKIRYSYTESFGTNNIPYNYTIVNHSFYVQFYKYINKLHNLALNIELATDLSNEKNNHGIILSVNKQL